MACNVDSAGRKPCVQRIGHWAFRGAVTRATTVLCRGSVSDSHVARDFANSDIRSAVRTGVREQLYLGPARGTHPATKAGRV